MLGGRKVAWKRELADRPRIPILVMTFVLKADTLGVLLVFVWVLLATTDDTNWRSHEIHEVGD